MYIYRTCKTHTNRSLKNSFSSHGVLEVAQLVSFHRSWYNSLIKLPRTSCAMKFDDSIFNSISVLSVALRELKCGRKLTIFVWNIAFLPAISWTLDQKVCDSLRGIFADWTNSKIGCIAFPFRRPWQDSRQCISKRSLVSTFLVSMSIIVSRN